MVIIEYDGKLHSGSEFIFCDQSEIILGHPKVYKKSSGLFVWGWGCTGGGPGPQPIIICDGMWAIEKDCSRLLPGQLLDITYLSSNQAKSMIKSAMEVNANFD